MERRDLKDERIQIPNEDLTVEMFDIDKKDFESGEAFLKADMKVKKKYFKAGYSSNPHIYFPKDNAAQIMSMLTAKVASKSSVWFESHPLTTLRIALFNTVRKLDLTGGVVYGYDGPSDKEFVFGAEIMLHIKARVERGNYMDDVF